MTGTTLVTGASGFLGGRLVDRLLRGESARQVVCLVRDVVPNAELFAAGLAHRTTVVHGDFRDVDLVQRVLLDYDVKSVFHLGAQTLVGNALANPMETLDVNVRGTWCVLEAVRRSQAQVEAVVLSSSDKAYGPLTGAEYLESDPLLGGAPYEVSKSCADLIAQCYARTYSLPIAVTRCSNLFGPGDLNLSRLFPSVIAAALKGERPVIRSNGRQVRDYLYVEDAVTGYLQLERAVAKGRCHGEAFNFASGQPLTVMEVVEGVASAIGAPLKADIRDTARCEIPRQALSSRKAREVLGWTPRVAFDQAVAETLAWYRQHPQVVNSTWTSVTSSSGSALPMNVS